MPRTEEPNMESKRFTLPPSAVLPVLAVPGLAACKSSEPEQESTSGAKAASASAAREHALLATLTASVEEIDRSTRQVTLKGPKGNEVTFQVDQRVKRLDE